MLLLNTPGSRECHPVCRIWESQRHTIETHTLDVLISGIDAIQTGDQNSTSSQVASKLSFDRIEHGGAVWNSSMHTGAEPATNAGRVFCQPNGRLMYCGVMGALLELESDDVNEEFFDRGWTDGLPVVPPTPERLAAMLAAANVDDPEMLIGFLAVRDRGVNLEQAAVNAVMAGCRPESFPIVVAALEAMFDPAFNLNTVLTSTGGAALSLVVSGPLAAEVGMNGRHNCLGHGNRANLTIGRALRLVATNALGSVPGVSDASSFGHPGKISQCFAEDPPPAPWEPLSVRLGYSADDTVVTVVAAEAPHQLAQQLTGDPEEILRSFAHSVRHPTWFSTGKGGHGVLILGPEHTSFCVAAGMSQEDVREHIFEAARIDAAELNAAGVGLEVDSQHDMTPAADGKIDTLASPDSVLLVTAGGEGAGWSAWIPGWAPERHSHRASRRVRPTGEALPDCGPDGCIVPWMQS